MFASFILVPYMRTSKVVYRINRFQITIYFAVCEKVNPFKVEQTLKTQFVLSSLAGAGGAKVPRAAGG